MNNNYEFLIPNEKLKIYHFFSFLLLALSGAAAAFMFFAKGENLGFVASFLMVASLFLLLFLKKEWLEIVKPEYFLIAAGSIWILNTVWLPGILLFVSGILGLIAKQKKFLKIDDEGIAYPSFPEKKYLWSDVESIILRNGLLTINLNNNHLIQQVVNVDKINEADFNRWVNDKINVIQ